MFKILCFLTFLSVVLAIENRQFLHANQSGEYYVSLFQLNFVQAYAACKRYGWSLAKERNSEESAAISATLTSVGASSSYHWIAGILQVDREFNPIWMWLDSGDEISYSNWQSGEPSNGDSDNCLLRGTSTQLGKWMSISCANEYYFICEV